MLRNLQRQLVPRIRSFCSHTCVESQGHHSHSPTLSNGHITFYGQPTAESHPHLLQPGEVTPGITLEEYQSRRSKLMQALTSVSQRQFQIDRVVAVIPSATKVYMTEKIPYPFRQNSDFLYLTGFMEPDSVLLLTSSGSDVSQQKSIMLVPKRDAHSELWDGPRTGADGAVHLLGVDEAYVTDDLQTILNSLVDGKDTKGSTLTFWCDYPALSHLPQFERLVKTCVKNRSPNYVDSPRGLIHQMRVIKSSAEANLMAHSGEIASQAFREAIRTTRPDVTEHELYARIDYECRLRGAERLAYPPVIAGGHRATTIHYIANNQKLCENELLLMDAGCEYHGYVSDITRTWPVNNQFEPLHKELYESLLDAQQRLIAICKDLPSLDQLYAHMIEILGTNLQQIGLVSKSLSGMEKSKVISKYCPHHVSHYLGMDVHDTATVSRSIPLKPGMVITVEPGVYVSRSDQMAPKEFLGIGMRIEDNVLITENGPVVLSANCPKTISQLESPRAQ